MGTQRRAAPVALELFFLWMRGQKFSQQHLPSFRGRNIIAKQNGERQILQPAVTLLVGEACVLFNSLLKGFPFPVWATF